MDKKKGFGKTYVTDDKDRVGAAPLDCINVDEIPRIVEELKAAKGTPNFNALKAKYEGPNTGLDYNEDTDEITIMSGWYVDTKGDVVKKVIK